MPPPRTGRWQAAGSLCLELPATPMEELVQGLPQHSRKTVRRRLNQLRKADPEIRAVEPGDAERAVGHLLRMHSAQWAGRRVNQDHLAPAFAAAAISTSCIAGW